MVRLMVRRLAWRFILLRHPLKELKEKKQLSEAVELRQNKYLNNRMEQNQRFINWLLKPVRGFKSFKTALAFN
ncbi:MAG: DDE-type integrase/transposase/recombinase [Scytonema sp. RU_4_4]|nr:DDE-type integrase/transposase/recombinase [Scytonema sp. RU_4_4]